MSLHTWNVGFLSIKPKIWMEDEVLFGRTSFIVQMLSLFSYCRFLRLSSRERTLELQVRKWWLLQECKILHFEEVDYIDYDFQSIGTSWGISPFYFERNDQVESYQVSLVLKSKEKVPLFRFSGEGSRETGWRGVLIGGDSLIDMAGDQDSVSRNFVDILKHILGVSIGPPLEHLADSDGHRYFCKRCNRPSAPNKSKCMYCGGPIFSPDKPKEALKVKKARCVKCKKPSRVGNNKCFYCGNSIEIYEVEE